MYVLKWVTYSGKHRASKPYATRELAEAAKVMHEKWSDRVFRVCEVKGSGK